MNIECSYRAANSLLAAIGHIAEAEDRGWQHHTIKVDGEIVYNSKNPCPLILRCSDESILNRKSWLNEAVVINDGDRIFTNLAEYQFHVKHGAGGKRECFFENGKFVTVIHPEITDYDTEHKGECIYDFWKQVKDV